MKKCLCTYLHVLKYVHIFLGHILLKLCDRSSLLSVVSHSLSAYITTLEPLPLQRYVFFDIILIIFYLFCSIVYYFWEEMK